MKDIHEIYCSYLLRVWKEPLDGDQWRFSLEDTRTGERRGFANLHKMTRYLADLTDQDSSLESGTKSKRKKNRS